MRFLMLWMKKKVAHPHQQIKVQRNEREGHNINGCMKKQSQKESNGLVKKDIPHEK